MQHNSQPAKDQSNQNHRNLPPPGGRQGRQVSPRARASALLNATNRPRLRSPQKPELYQVGIGEVDGLRLVVGRLVHALLCTMKFGTRLSSSPGSKCSSSHSLTRRPSFADSSELCCCCCRAPHNSQMQLFVGLGWRFFFR